MRAHAVVDVWLREGRLEPAPAGVRRHIESCPTCARVIAEIDRVRGWFPDSGDFVAPESVRAIRFHLQAAARAPRDPSVRERRGGRLQWPLGWLIAGLTLVAVLVAAWLLQPEGRRGAQVEQPFFASVEPLGASVRRVLRGADELYLMDQGAAGFTVSRVPAGQRVIVQVGSDRVIVHGTRFQVQGDAGRLIAVSVYEGLVVLELSGREPFPLAAGQSWRAPTAEEHGARSGVDAGYTDGASASAASPAIRDVPPSPERVRRGVRGPAPAIIAERSKTGAARVDAGRSGSDVGARDRDTAFQAAWALYRAGRYDAASLAFDSLMHEELGARRSDVLFWSAQAHQLSGRPERAAALYRDLLRKYPEAWRAGEARAELERLEVRRGEKSSGSASSGQSR